MDILYITQAVEERLKEFCSEDLIQYVFEDFRKHATIAIKEETHVPSKMWVMSDFIRDKSINIIDKMNVVLSFIASGGIIQIDGIPYFDTSNPLAIVNRLGIINDEQLEILNDPWFFYNYKNIKPHFKLS